MKLLAIFCFVAVVAAAPPLQKIEYSKGNDVQILRYDNDNIGLGNFRYSFEQSDGTKQEQQGEIRNPGTDDEFVAIQGYYSWVDPNGVTYLITYKADDNGFQPQIEQGPGGGVPPAVVASLLG